MKNLIISPGVMLKINDKHSVSEREVCQAFENKCGCNLIDTREDPDADPATLWFIAETNKERLLKIVFKVIDGNTHLLTAYEPNQDEIRIYDKHGK